MKQAMAQTQSLDDAKIAIEKLTVKGNIATSVSTMSLTMTMMDSTGEMGPKGKAHKMSMTERSRETWVKTSGGWKAKHSEDLPGGKMLLDGKPFNPMAPPSQPPKKK
jgi:hypothetical protein